MNHTLSIFFIIATTHITFLFSGEAPKSCAQKILRLIEISKEERGRAEVFFCLVLSNSLPPCFPCRIQKLIREYVKEEEDADAKRGNCNSFIPYYADRNAGSLFTFAPANRDDQPDILGPFFYIFSHNEKDLIPMAKMYQFIEQDERLLHRGDASFKEIFTKEFDTQVILRSFNMPPAAQELCIAFDAINIYYDYSPELQKEAIAHKIPLLAQQRSYYALRIILGLFSYHNISAKPRGSSIVQEGQRRSAVLLGPRMTHHNFASLLQTTLLDFMRIQSTLPKKSFAQLLTNPKWHGIGWQLDDVLARYDKAEPEGLYKPIGDALADKSLALVFSPQ